MNREVKELVDGLIKLGNKAWKLGMSEDIREVEHWKRMMDCDAPTWHHDLLVGTKVVVIYDGSERIITDHVRAGYRTVDEAGFHCTFAVDKVLEVPPRPDDTEEYTVTRFAQPKQGTDSGWLTDEDHPRWFSAVGHSVDSDSYGYRWCTKRKEPQPQRTKVSGWQTKWLRATVLRKTGEVVKVRVVNARWPKAVGKVSVEFSLLASTVDLGTGTLPCVEELL